MSSHPLHTISNNKHLEKDISLILQQEIEIDSKKNSVMIIDNDYYDDKTLGMTGMGGNNKYHELN